MIKVAINGINGKMGKVLSNAVRTQEDMELVCGFDIYDDGTNGCPVYKAPADCSEKVDVVIDFSNAKAVDEFCEGKDIVKYPIGDGLSIALQF